MKKLIIGVLVVGLLAGGIFGLLAANSLSVSTGRCLVADNGSVMLVKDESPIVMSKQGGPGMFNGLATGDEILVVHNGIEESYPGGTGAYLIIRLGGGSLADIPAEVIYSLTELGWLS